MDKEVQVQSAGCPGSRTGAEGGGAKRGWGRHGASGMGCPGPWEKAVFTPRGSDWQGDPSPDITPTLDRGVSARPPPPWDPHSPPACPYPTRSGPADRPAAACGHCGPLAWLAPAAAPPGRGRGGYGSREVTAPSLLPCSLLPPPHCPVRSQSRNHVPLPSSWGPCGPKLGE